MAAPPARRHVLFFRDGGGGAGYAAAATAVGASSSFIPPSVEVEVDTSPLREVAASVCCRPASVGGVILTSQRAAHAMLSALDEHARIAHAAAPSAAGAATAPRPSTVPCFALGKSAAAVRSSGWFARVQGDSAKTGAELSEHVLEFVSSGDGGAGDECTGDGGPTWLFLTGEAHMDAIPTALGAAGIPLTTVVVYRMEEVDEHVLRREMHEAMCVDTGGGVDSTLTHPPLSALWVLFSPAGVGTVSRHPAALHAMATGDWSPGMAWGAPSSAGGSEGDDGRAGPVLARVATACIGHTTAAALRAAVTPYLERRGGLAPPSPLIFPHPDAAGFAAVLHRWSGAVP